MSTKQSSAFLEPRFRKTGIAPKTRRERITSSQFGLHTVHNETINSLCARASEPIVRLGQAEPIPCPCCKTPVSVPQLQIVIDHYKVTPLEASILGAVWKGKGHPVPTERIFDAMYADDPDGGPSPTQMYRAFKVSLCRMRARLEGSGISIENVGYRRGYRLIIGEA